jgi:hypothetical protein
LHGAAQTRQQVVAVVPIDAAAQADALQIQRRDQVVEHAPHHVTQRVNDGDGLCITAVSSGK